MANSNIMWRIDDRLIHGQVIVGWCGQLPIKLLVVCDDEISAQEWEKNLLLLAAPPELKAEVLSIAETAEAVTRWIKEDLIVMVLLKSVHSLKKLIDAGVAISKVNIGGIHFQEDRREYLSYLYLSREEAEIFEKLISMGIKFECQDLPNSPVYNLQRLIEKKK